MTPPTGPIPIIPHIAPLAASRAAWLVDIWGVMHNGVAPFQSAVQACQTFRARGGVVLLLSNAPRPGESVQGQLDRIGVARDAYDGIVSSGDVAQKHVTRLGEAKVYHLGPERDLSLYEKFRGSRVAPDDAEVIVCTGLFDDETETPETYRALLTTLAQRQLPMICANPDLKVERGGKVIYCAGALAALYAELGGDVTYAGKPHPPIYQQAKSTLAALSAAPIGAQDILAIGDGVHTDIEGAAGAGIDAVFVASKVHVSKGALTQGTLQELFVNAAFKPPIAAMTALVW